MPTYEKSRPGARVPTAGRRSRRSWCTMSGGRSLITTSSEPSAQLQAAHGVVGHHLQHDAGVVGQAVEVALERRQRDVIVVGVLDEAVRTGADRKRAEGVARTGRHDGRLQHELHRERRRTAPSAGTRRCSRRAPSRIAATLNAPLMRRDVGGIEERAVGVDDVGGGQLVPVVKADAAAQVRDVGERVGIVESRCQVGLRLQIGAQDDQRAEDQLRDALRDLVAGLTRIERVGRGPDPDR